MQNNNNPGHTIGGGYPFEKNESKALWLNRPKVYIEDASNKAFFDPAGIEYEENVVRTNTVAIAFHKWMKEYFDTQANLNKTDQELYEIFCQEPEFKDLMVFEDFMMFRAAEFCKMLEIAENQIDDMLHEDPFVPETFGFELAHRNMGIHEPPVRIYLSKYNDRYTLFRKPGTPGDKDWNPMAWILKEKMPDGSFKDIDLNLCSHRIAYTAFYALGVQVKDKSFMEKVADEVRELMAEDNTHEEPKEMIGVYPIIETAESEKAVPEYIIFDSHRDDIDEPKTDFFVKYKMDDDACCIHIEKDVYLNADNEIEAMLKTKEILENIDPLYHRSIYPNQLSPFVTSQWSHKRRSAIEPIRQMKSLHIDSERGFTQEEVNYAKLWFISRVWYKNTDYVVMFFRSVNKEIDGRFVDVNAGDKTEALTKAKFILETDADHPIEDVKFEELSIIK